MSSAKEGTRTLTGVTPLEPEPTSGTGKRQSLRVVGSKRGVSVGQQKTAANRGQVGNSGACTETSATGKLRHGQGVRITQGLSAGKLGKVLGLFGTFGPNEPLYRIELDGIERVIRHTYLEVVS